MLLFLSWFYKDNEQVVERLVILVPGTQNGKLPPLPRSSEINVIVSIPFGPTLLLFLFLFHY